MSKAQKNYTTLEKELLSIVETLLEYRTFLSGARIFAFTDHKNLVYSNSSQRALRWFSIIGEFGVTFIHRKGANNTGADALSRLPIVDADEPLSVQKAQEQFDQSYLFYPIQYQVNTHCPIRLNVLQAKQQADPYLQEQLIRR